MRFKKKKVKKYRGSKTHGCGSMKKRRGAGHRGGRGRAGSGKRADTKKPSYWKQKTGKKGFTSKSRKEIKPLNLEMINKNLNLWIKKGVIVKKPAGYEVELKKIGYNKLLAKGKIKEKLVIITDFASKKAVDKVAKAGGEVKILKTKKIKIKKKESQKTKKEESKEDKDEDEGEGKKNKTAPK